MKKAITKHWIAKASIDYSVTTLKEIGYKATISKPWFPENPNGLMKIHWKSSKFFPPTVEGKKAALSCAERELAKITARSERDDAERKANSDAVQALYK